MALEHEFYLIAQDTDIREYWQYTHDEKTYVDCVVLHDDLILYIIDSLKWIPTKNPGIRTVRPINFYNISLRYLP